MQIIKILILFLIFIIATFIGKIIARKYKYRVEELKEMKNVLNMFKTKIKFTYDPIPEIFDEISNNSSKNISKIFIEAKKNMEKETAGISWEKAVMNSQNNLNEEDKKTINTMSKMLGESDIDGQLSQIDITLNFLEKQISEAEQEKNRNEKLYQKLGTITGIALVIVLV